MSLFNERIQDMINNYKKHRTNCPTEHTLFWDTRISEMEKYLAKRIKEGKN